jgi:hypothetical protein
VSESVLVGTRTRQVRLLFSATLRFQSVSLIFTHSASAFLECVEIIIVSAFEKEVQHTFLRSLSEQERWTSNEPFVDCTPIHTPEITWLLSQ